MLLHLGISFMVFMVQFHLGDKLLQVNSQHLEQIDLEPFELALVELETLLVDVVFPLCVVRIGVYPLEALAALDRELVGAVDEL